MRSWVAQCGRRLTPPSQLEWAAPQASPSSQDPVAYAPCSPIQVDTCPWTCTPETLGTVSYKVVICSPESQIQQETQWPMLIKAIPPRGAHSQENPLDRPTPSLTI